MGIELSMNNDPFDSLRMSEAEKDDPSPTVTLGMITELKSLIYSI